MLNTTEKLDIISTEDFQKYLHNLATFANNYIPEIQKDLVKKAVEMYKDKTTVKLLDEYTQRTAEEIDNLTRDFNFACQHENEEITLDNNCLTNSSHYKTVLYDLIVKSKSNILEVKDPIKDYCKKKTINFKSKTNEKEL